MCRHLNIGFLLCELHTVPPWKLRIFSKSVAEPRTDPQSYSWVSLIPEQVRVTLQQDLALRSCEDRREQKEASDFWGHGTFWRNQGNRIRKYLGTWSLLFCINHWPGSNLACLPWCCREGGTKRKPDQSGQRRVLFVFLMIDFCHLFSNKNNNRFFLSIRLSWVSVYSLQLA